MYSLFYNITEVPLSVWRARTVLESAGKQVSTTVTIFYSGDEMRLTYLQLCSDLRLGIQAQTVAKDFEKVFEVSDKVFVGLAGLASDVISLNQLLTFKTNMYRFREHREMKPETFSALLSTMLYEKRFGPWFCEPIVAGLTEDDKPFLSGMDLIGAPVFTDDFVVSGTCTANLHGMCESMYRPDMVSVMTFGVDLSMIGAVWVD
jgi:20S proteasome alpha/beta subunit